MGNLRLSHGLVLEICIVPVVQERVWVRMTVVLPALQNIFLMGLQSSGPLEKDSSLVCDNSLPGYPDSRFLWDIGWEFWLKT